MTGRTTEVGTDVSTEIRDADPAPDHDVRAVLRITPFRRLWLALGLSSLGDWLGLLATAALAGRLANGSYTSQNFAIAGVFLLRLAPAVVLGPIAGALADRFDRRWTLVVGDLVRFALFGSIVVVGTLPWLYVATILIECAALFWGPANDATIPNLVPRRRLEAANQLGLVATYGSAPVAAGLYAVLAVIADTSTAMPSLPDINPISVALWVNAVTFLISALVIWRLDFPPSTARAAARQVGVVRSILDGWRYVAGTPVVRGLVLGMLGAFAAGGFVVGLAQTFVADLGAGQAGFGILFGAVFVGLAAGMWIGPRVLVSLSRRRLFGMSLVAAGGCLLMLALVPDLVLAITSTVSLGLCGGVAWVTGYTLLGLETDDEVRGRTFGFVNSAARVVLVLVLAVGPALAALIGTHTLVLPWGDRLAYNGAAWVFGLAGLLAIGMGLAAYRQMDDRPGVRLRSELARVWTSRHESETVTRSSARTHNGWLIAFEGGDGTGKSTQARVFADWLRVDQGHDVVLTREPGATAVGVRLREVLLGEGEPVGPRAEALLFAADRAHHVDSLVKPALDRGAIVITDRYVDSSIAYQGAGRALDADEIAYISRWATGGLVPDLTVLLDIPPEISRIRRANDPERSGADRLEAQPEEFHQRVREGFLELARREPQRYLVLDGSDPREEIQEAIRRRCRDIVPISRKR
ncbi:MAG: dTMP kinase, partial [Kineosporiaceae bacterium]